MFWNGTQPTGGMLSLVEVVDMPTHHADQYWGTFGCVQIFELSGLFHVGRNCDYGERRTKIRGRVTQCPIPDSLSL